MHHSFLIIFIILATADLLMNWYVFSGLKTFTKEWISAAWRKAVVWGMPGFSLFITILFIASLGSFNKARGLLPFHEYELSLFIVFLITKLFFIIILFIGDISRLFYGLIRGIVHHGKKKDKPFIPARRRFVSEIAILTASVPFAALIYGMIKGKYDYRV